MPPKQGDKLVNLIYPEQTRLSNGTLGLDFTGTTNDPGMIESAIARYKNSKPWWSGLQDFVTGKASFQDALSGKINVEQNINTKTASYWEEYYSGTDVLLMIGDVWVDDVITINYTLTNNKSPVYGYMSENFDAVAKGTRIVQGQFAIAFREVGYLNKILENYDAKTYSPKRATNDRNILTSDEVEEFKRTGILPKTSELLDSVNAEKYFTEAEKDVLNGGFKTADRYSYQPTYVKRSGFDIMVSFGDVGETDRGGTISVINNCHITSISLACEPTGEPIAEVYSFFGRTLNQGVPNAKRYFLEEKQQKNQNEALTKAQVEQKQRISDATTTSSAPVQEGVNVTMDIPKSKLDLTMEDYLTIQSKVSVDKTDTIKTTDGNSIIHVQATPLPEYQGDPELDQARAMSYKVDEASEIHKVEEQKIINTNLNYLNIKDSTANAEALKTSNELSDYFTQSPAVRLRKMQEAQKARLQN